MVDTPNLVASAAGLPSESLQGQTPAHHSPLQDPEQNLPTASRTSGVQVLHPQTVGWQYQCTHLAKTRRFITHEDERCDECHLRPPLGWLYVCSDDNNNFLPEEDNLFPLPPDLPVKETDLSPWIVRAIAQGHYSRQEIDTLIRQKANVYDTVAETRNMNQISTVTHLVIQSSSDDNDYDDDDDEEAWMEDVDEIDEQEAAAETSRIYVQGPQVNDILSSMVGPRCSGYCHTCRPSFRDRSWASLNAVCTEANDELQKAQGPTTTEENSGGKLQVIPPSLDLSSGTVNIIYDDQREQPCELQPELGMDSNRTSNQPSSKEGERQRTELETEDEGEGIIAKERSENPIKLHC